MKPAQSQQNLEGHLKNQQNSNITLGTLIQVISSSTNRWRTTSTTWARRLTWLGTVIPWAAEPLWWLTVPPVGSGTDPNNLGVNCTRNTVLQLQIQLRKHILCNNKTRQLLSDLSIKNTTIIIKLNKMSYGQMRTLLERHEQQLAPRCSSR